LSTTAGGDIPAGADPVDPALGPMAWAAVGIVCLLLNGLFVMAQTSVAALGETAANDLRAGRNPLDRWLAARLDRLPFFEQKFAAASLLMLILAALSFGESAVQAIPRLPVVSAGLGVLAALIAHLVFSEVFTRSIALSNPSMVFRAIVPPCYFLAYPILPFLLPGRLFGGLRPRNDRPTALADMQLRLLPSLSGIERVLETEAIEMIDSVRDFAESTAQDIMTPRTEVDGIDDQMDAASIYESLRRSPYSRLVVYHRTLDEIRGTLLVKEVLLRRPADPLSLLRTPIYTSETTRLPELLRLVRANRSHLVIVQDEYGGMSGIVTLHDLFEAIVGHIEDVEDEAELWIERIDETNWRLNGRVEVWEINEELGHLLNEDRARTIGGYLFNSLGRVAREGDTLEENGIRLVVEKTVENRVEIVRLTTGITPAETPMPEGARDE
jgi:putative hemolysin